MGDQVFYRTTIVIYSPYDPSEIEIDALAQDAMAGESICIVQEETSVKASDLPGEAREFLIPEVGP